MSRAVNIFQSHNLFHKRFPFYLLLSIESLSSEDKNTVEDKTYITFAVCEMHDCHYVSMCICQLQSLQNSVTLKLKTQNKTF